MKRIAKPLAGSVVEPELKLKCLLDGAEITTCGFGSDLKKFYRKNFWFH
jgi:hypothetical protein